jgi:hypothetical protein
LLIARLPLADSMTLKAAPSSGAEYEPKKLFMPRLPSIE